MIDPNKEINTADTAITIFSLENQSTSLSNTRIMYEWHK